MIGVRNDSHERKWWKEATTYQIYPASFKDSNNDGVGDLNGIISKLDYLRALGVDVIWVSPHFASPQVDMGYDISDYEDIHRPYGTVEECQRMIDEVHKRKMRVIFDLVINHTSDQHKWFKESRSSKTNPKRDWYIWRPAKYDKDGNRQQPNNWQGNFTVPAWTWDETTQEYYLHLFASEQPDLNWENEECRKAIYDSAIKFWLDKGVDGFRVDTVNLYSKQYQYNADTKMWDLPDAPMTNPEEKYQFANTLYCNGPRIHEFLREMNDIFDKYDIMTVGELPHTPDVNEVMTYISAKERQLNMVFNFDVVNLGQSKSPRFALVPFTTADFKRELFRWQHIAGTDAWTTAFLENHDQGRCISRFASDRPEYGEQAAKMFAMILGSLTGTLFLYQGQEIGMTNAPRSWPGEEYKCIKSVNFWSDVKAKTNSDPSALSKALDGMQAVARDHARVPMQWDSSPNAGFCDASATPWMRVVDNYTEINVAEQEGREGSVLEFYKTVLRLRKQYKDLFIYGDFREVASSDHLLMFTKNNGERLSLTVANLASERCAWVVPAELAELELEVVASNKGGKSDSLEPYEARIYVLT